MATTTTLYAWAHPLSAWRSADHTWVTTFPAPAACPPPKDYWYCWGICYSTGSGTGARLLRSGPGVLGVASCICAPNDHKAHGGITFYGIEGVCHQLANRVLYASTPKQTVAGAHLYGLSVFVFGPYGTTTADWARRRQRCGAGPQGTAGGGGGGTMAAVDDEADDQQAFFQMLREQMGSEATPETLAQVEQIRASLLAEKARLDEDVQAGRLSGEEFARRVNDLVSSYLPRLAEVIGLEGMREVIGAQPGESVQLLDPAMAAICNYRQPAKSEQR